MDKKQTETINALLTCFGSLGMSVKREILDFCCDSEASIGLFICEPLISIASFCMVQRLTNVCNRAKN